MFFYMSFSITIIICPRFWNPYVDPKIDGIESFFSYNKHFKLHISRYMKNFANHTYFPKRLFKSVYINVEAEVSIVCEKKAQLFYTLKISQVKVK